MSLAIKVNFLKGWPSPTIVEKVATAATGVTTLEAGKVGTLDATGKWVLGISKVNQVPYVFRNDQDSPDAGRAAHENDYVQASFSGVQGISHNNQIEYQTIQFDGTPAVGDRLYADTDGKLKVAVKASDDSIVANSKVIVALCTGAPATYQGLSYITVVPDNSKDVTEAAQG